MELDKRIVEGKRPLTCFDIDEARKYVGKLCYVSNSYDCFRDLKNLVEEVILIDVEDCETPFHFYIDNQREFCLPAEWVKSEEPEKKYRPFSLNEFLERYKIGDTVTFRMKKDEHIPEAECLVEYKRMITGYEILPEDKDTPGKGSILLGGCPPTGLARLFEFYELENEYYFPTVWQPFGVEVEDEE